MTMSGNAVVFRTQRIVARLGVAGTTASMGIPASDGQTRTLGSIEEIDGRPGLADQLGERLAAARARWAQLTFYLSSPDSWR
jgi:hypothetical protein